VSVAKRFVNLPGAWRIVLGMGKRITAAIAAVAVTLEAIFSHHAALPHTEVTKPPDSGKDIPSTDGRRRAKSATLTIIPTEDLVTMPTTGKHFSLAAIRAEGSPTDDKK
jgi:hypothetical protein